ncbi:MAG: hypothetical protein AB7V40_03600 [Methyloceanibacter sp.]
MTTATVNGTTVWVGGGVQFLSLPDIKFTAVGNPSSFRRQKNSEADWADFGGAVGGGIETGIGFWGDTRVTAGIKGFWSNVETDHTANCSIGCVVIDPATGFLQNGSTLRTKTSRDADYWGGQAELKFGRAQPVYEKPNFYRNDYFIVGADIRGIDQDNKLRGRAFNGFDVFTYNETLDTTYTGGYIGIGGEYSFGFIPGVKNVGGIYDRLGLRTFVNLKAGLYNADTDYTGKFAFNYLPFNTRISQSQDDLAFIGTVSLETRKQIGMRSSLSLWTDYEYISSVPEMRYNNASGRPTRIEDDGVFASRTMLRLNIGFGPSQLYEEPK